MPVRRGQMHPASGFMMLTDTEKVDVANVINVSVDPRGVLKSLTYAHAAVHSDTIVNSTHYAAAGTDDLLYFFTNGSPLQAHLEYKVTVGGPAIIRFYEGPTVATAGTAVPTTRLFRPSTKTTQASITQGGTVTAEAYGTLLKEQYNGGTTGTGQSTVGAAAVHADAEYVLTVGETYCLRITRAESVQMSVEFEWYEVTAF